MESSNTWLSCSPGITSVTSWCQMVPFNCKLGAHKTRLINRSFLWETDSLLSARKSTLLLMVSKWKGWALGKGIFSIFVWCHFLVALSGKYTAAVWRFRVQKRHSWRREKQCSCLTTGWCSFKVRIYYTCACLQKSIDFFGVQSPFSRKF